MREVRVAHGRADGLHALEGRVKLRAVRRDEAVDAQVAVGDVAAWRAEGRLRRVRLEAWPDVLCRAQRIGKRSPHANTARLLLTHERRHGGAT